MVVIVLLMKKIYKTKNTKENVIYNTVSLLNLELARKHYVQVMHIIPLLEKSHFILSLRTYNQKVW